MIKTIDFNQVTQNGKIRNLLGREKGEAARVKFKLDELDKAQDPVEVKIPPTLICASFILFPWAVL